MRLVITLFYSIIVESIIISLFWLKVNIFVLFVSGNIIIRNSYSAINIFYILNYIV